MLRKTTLIQKTSGAGARMEHALNAGLLNRVSKIRDSGHLLAQRAQGKEPDTNCRLQGYFKPVVRNRRYCERTGKKAKEYRCISKIDCGAKRFQCDKYAQLQREMPKIDRVGHVAKTSQPLPSANYSELRDCQKPDDC